MRSEDTRSRVALRYLSSARSSLVWGVGNEEVHDPEQGVATMFIPTPRSKKHRVWSQGHDLLCHRTGVNIVVAGQHQERRPGGADEVSVDGEDEVAAEQALPEGGCDRVVQLRVGAPHLHCPLLEHGVELWPIVRGEANRVLEHGRGYAIRDLLAESERVGAADAATHHVEALQAEVVHQRQLILQVDVPAVIGTDRRQRGAGVALVHPNHLEAVAEVLERVDLMPFFKRGSATISYEVRGSGFPLLLLAPGGMRSAAMWWAVVLKQVDGAFDWGGGEAAGSGQIGRCLDLECIMARPSS